MNILLDTSFLCALRNERDAHHGEATRLFLEAIGVHVLIPTIVIAELLIGDNDGHAIIRMCRELSGSFLSVTEKDLQKIADFPHSLRKKLKSNDCLVLAHALVHGADLWTFDKPLMKAYVRLVANTHA